MALSKIDLDRFATAKIFSFGTTSSGGDANITINKGSLSASSVIFTVKASAQIDGNLNVTGNINVIGSLNNQSVTNMDVEDKTITVNKGGPASSGTGSGVQVEENSSIVGKVLYDSSLASKWKVGDATTQNEIVDVSSTQTLINKIISFVDNTIQGFLSVVNGGTGRNTLTSNNLLVGNGTGQVNFIAPGTSGYVLTSNGTSFVVSAPKYPRLISFTGALNGTNTVFTLSTPIIADTDQVFLTAVKMRGGNNDYTLNGGGDTVTFNFAPLSTDWIEIYGVEQ